MELGDANDLCVENTSIHTAPRPGEPFATIKLYSKSGTIHHETYAYNAGADLGYVARDVALKVNNGLAIVGADRVGIQHNTPLRPTDFRREIYRILGDRRLDIGSTQDLILRAYGSEITIHVESAEVFDDTKVRSPLALTPLCPKKFLPGRHYSLNIGHSITSFGIVDIDEGGSILQQPLRLRTESLKNIDEILNFIGRYTDHLGVANISCRDSDHKISVAVAEPVYRGRVMLNDGSVVSRILFDLQNGPFGGLLDYCAPNAGNYFVMNDSCATGVYVSRNLTPYKGGSVSGFLPRTLAIRFGTYSAISYIGDNGYNIDRLNEYSHIAIIGGTASDTLKRIGSALSYRAFQMHEPFDLRYGDNHSAKASNSDHMISSIYTGLSQKINLFSDMCMDAGRTIAYLISEVRRFNVVDNVVVIGSVANGIDATAWASIHIGITEAINSNEIGALLPALHFLPHASDRSSLLGVALEHSERLALAERA